MIGFARIGSSRAAGATFLPPAVTMISFLRPVMVRKPSESKLPMSPVRNQPPSLNASAVASGLFQYSLKTLMPRTSISPSSARRTPTPGSAGPTVPIFDLSARFTVAGAGVDDVAAHGLAKLAVHELVEQGELELGAEGDLLPLFDELRVLDGDIR